MIQHPRDLPNIAFIGKMGAGKTTAAELLAKYYGYDRMSFAKPLKIGCGTTDDREILIAVGMEIRALYEDFFVNLLAHELDRHGDRDPVTIDDCRFPNEVRRLTEYGFRIVRIVAGHGLRKQRLLANGRLQDESQMYGPSEEALDNLRVDFVISNERSPEELLLKIADYLSYQRGRD